MKKRIRWFLVGVVYLVLGSCSAFASDETTQCARAIDRITTASEREGAPVAKLLVDFAIVDAVPLGCSREQRDQLLALRRSIYVQCIGEEITRAKNVAIMDHDGLSAVYILRKVYRMADVIDAELYGLDELHSVVFYSAANQCNEMAIVAEKEGRIELASQLRSQAREFMKWATAFDERIKQLIPKKTGQ